MAPPAAAKEGGKKGGKGPIVPLIGITVTKEENFSQWYQEVVTKCEMVEYYTEVRRTRIAASRRNAWLRCAELS